MERLEGWLVQIFPAEFGFKWTDHIVDGVRDDDQHQHHNILFAIIQSQDGPLKCSLHWEITGMQKRVTCPLRPLMIKSGIIGKKTQSSSPMSWMGLDVEVLIFGKSYLLEKLSWIVSWLRIFIYYHHCALVLGSQICVYVTYWKS